LQYIDRITLHNFRSFKHATVRFSKGFNCVVGPNGSGKSNLCGALLFALGEHSSRRMGAPSASQLISTFAKADQEMKLKRMHVSVTLAGDSNIEITRIARSDNKIAYRLNGKRSNRQDVIDVLQANGCWVNETNTLTQGESRRIMDLNSKERRELLDVASGIKEFDEKRDAAMKELEKVEQKISGARIMLSERMGFLNDLKKQKDDALQYMELSNSIKDMTFTLLKNRERDVSTKYEEALKLLNENSSTVKKINESLKGIEAKLAGLSERYTKTSGELNAKSIEVNSSNRQLEELNKEIALNEQKATELEREIGRAREHADVLDEERKKLTKQKESNSLQLKRIESELKGRSETLNSYETSEEFAGTKLISNYEETQERLYGLMGALETVSKEYFKAASEKSVLDATLERIREQTKTLTDNRPGLEKIISELGQKKRGATEKLSAEKEKLAAHSKQMQSYKLELSKLDEKNINLRDELASSGGGTDSIANLLKKEIRSGFYGRAYELCSYDDKYANAVAAAAGNRFNYFVVDSIDIATQAIEIIKRKGLGRASFVPVQELSVKPVKAQQDLEPLLKVVKFEKRFSKVFEFVFSNTYIVESIRDAKEKGIGSNRYVTITGEVIDPAGIITGGTIKHKQAGTILAELKSVEASKSEINEKISLIDNESNELRKAIGAYETELMGIDFEIKKDSESLADLKSELLAVQNKESKAASETGAIEERITATNSKKAAIETEISRIKSDSERTKLQVPKSAKKGIDRGELNRLKTLRQEVEDLKVSAASLTKENEMIESRVKEVAKERERELRNVSDATEQKGSLEERGKSTKKQKTSVEEKIKSHDTGSASLYKQLTSINDDLAGVGQEKGKLESERERHQRSSIELEGTRAQLQTRLSDIKAELLKYVDVKESSVPARELETRIADANKRLELLGGVNMKAPEMYDAKSKDVEEAETRLSTLDNEKNSILTMIKEIESKKFSIFMETFNTVNQNFQKLYGYAFEGTAALALESTKEPFRGGLFINVKNSSGRLHNIEIMSGGEKSLILLILLFAIQMRNPMSFYIFDEIDASLDKENSKKLSLLIKEMSSKSQFIVISHNDAMISAADAAIGVARQGVESKAVGMELVNIEKVSSKANNGA